MQHTTLETALAKELRLLCMRHTTLETALVEKCLDAEMVCMA
jgi:hypothetical protein